MKRIYDECDQYVIVEENGKFGIEDKNGHVLMPFRYDNIYVANTSRDAVGFVLCQEGKFGYIEFGGRERLDEDEYGVVLGDPNGCALTFLPCMYDRIETTCNGLVLYQNTADGERRMWYDYESRTLHRDLYWIHNFGPFDTFLIEGHTSCMPTLKKAGEDEWVKFPRDSGADPWQEIPLDTVGVRCILCMEEISSTNEEDEGVIDGYEYFFLLLYKDGWMPTPAKRNLAELYADLPAIIEGINNRKNNKNENEKKQVYSLLCRYKRKNEEWD